MLLCRLPSGVVASNMSTSNVMQNIQAELDAAIHNHLRECGEDASLKVDLLIASALRQLPPAIRDMSVKDAFLLGAQDFKQLPSRPPPVVDMNSVGMMTAEDLRASLSAWSQFSSEIHGVHSGLEAMSQAERNSIVQELT